MRRNSTVEIGELSPYAAAGICGYPHRGEYCRTRGKEGGMYALNGCSPTEETQKNACG